MSLDSNKAVIMGHWYASDDISEIIGSIIEKNNLFECFLLRDSLREAFEKGYQLGVTHGWHIEQEKDIKAES